MNTHKVLRDKIHNLNESLNVMEYIIRLVEKEGYKFSDSDAPHYIAEMKKVVSCIRDTREYITEASATRLHN